MYDGRNPCQNDMTPYNGNTQIYMKYHHPIGRLDMEYLALVGQAVSTMSALHMEDVISTSLV